MIGQSPLVNRCLRSRSRRDQAGLTLVEMIVALAILTIGIVGVAGAVAELQHIAAFNQQQATLETTMRQLADWVRNSSTPTCGAGPSGCPSLPYRTCANAGAYNTFVQQAETNGSLSNAIGLTPIRNVYVSSAGTRTGSGAPVLEPALASCTASSGDWGVQEIKVQISAGPSTLTRVIWKSIA